MIQCIICKREFKSIITNSHLKSHGITTMEYKMRYGDNSLSTEAYRIKKSQAAMGVNNPHYGKPHTEQTKKLISIKTTGIIKSPYSLSDEHISNLRNAIKLREEKYNTKKLIRHKVIHSNETKKKISKSVSDYAKNNPDKIQKRAVAAIQTKRKNGPIVSSMKGRKHTEEAKAKMAISAAKANQRKTEKSHTLIYDRITKSNLQLINSLYAIHLELYCNNCNLNFSITKQYFNSSKFHDKICPGCYPRSIVRSQAEMELYKFIHRLHPTAVANDRTILNGLEIDILLPELYIGFEFSGLYWHSETSNVLVGRNKAFDLYKQTLAEKYGVRLYIIFEDEWDNNRNIVESRIRNILNVQDEMNKIYARKCTIKEISSNIANSFLNVNHLQGSGRSNVRYGLYHDDMLVSVMTFSNNNISRKIYQWEINRFCSLINTSVVGGASRLFKKFIDDFSPDYVLSYADTRWSSGGVYNTLGFTLDSKTSPNYWYFMPNECIRKHRFGLRKNKNDDQSLTEYENRLRDGYLRIWDCGSTKWVWTP